MNKQPNKKCYKCKRDIKQVPNEKTNSYEYAEVFSAYKQNYYCNKCLEKLLNNKLNGK